MAAEVSKATSWAGCGSLSKFLLAWVIISHKPSTAVLALVTRPLQWLLAGLCAKQLWGGGLSVPDKPPSCFHLLLHLAWGEQETIIWKACSCLLEPWPSPESALQRHTLLPGMRGSPHVTLPAVPTAQVTPCSIPNTLVVGMWLLWVQGCLNWGGGMLPNWELTSCFCCWFVFWNLWKWFFF